MRLSSFAILLFVASGFGQNTFTLKRTTIHDFGFLSGCWVLDRPERKMRTVEQWMSPAGRTMIGMSRTVKDGKTTGWEYMRIEESDTGIFFISRPKENKEETYFKFAISEFNASPKDTKAVFENPDHDFPQRVIYRSEKPDTLDARIEGTQNGKSSGIDFPYKRVKCD